MLVDFIGGGGDFFYWILCISITNCMAVAIHMYGMCVWEREGGWGVTDISLFLLSAIMINLILILVCVRIHISICRHMNYGFDSTWLAILNEHGFVYAVRFINVVWFNVTVLKMGYGTSNISNYSWHI